MKLLHILFGVMFCFAYVSGRNLHENVRNDEFSDRGSEKATRDPTVNQLRHRRRSSEAFFDYNYQDYRRDIGRQKEDTYNQILELLEEIVHNLKRASSTPAPPPAQPIYVPYPVPIYVPQNANCNNQGVTNINGTPGIFDRWPDFIEDDNQIFGVVPGTVDTGNSDGSKPINLDPIVTESPLDLSTANQQQKPQNKRPGLCKAAVLTCCNLKLAEQRACFVKYNCPRTYETGLACRPEVIQKVLEEFSKAYAPINRV